MGFKGCFYNASKTTYFVGDGFHKASATVFEVKVVPFLFSPPLISCYSRLEGDRGAIPTLSMVSINLR